MTRTPAWPAPLLAVAPAALPVLAAAGTLVERDERGRRIGTVETRPGGDAVLRDVQGRRTGTMERSGNELIRRDAQGRRVGTVERARRGAKAIGRRSPQRAEDGLACVWPALFPARVVSIEPDV